MLTLGSGEDHPVESGGKVRLTQIIVPSLVRPKVPPTSHALLTPETSDLSAQSSSDRDTNGTETDNETASEADTEMGEDIGYTLDPVPSTPSFEDAMAELNLDRTSSLSRAVSNSSSLYASSEGGSDMSTLADSLTLPLPPAGNGGWTLVSDGRSDAGGAEQPEAITRVPARNTGRCWKDRSTFFEFLYGT